MSSETISASAGVTRRQGLGILGSLRDGKGFDIVLVGAALLFLLALAGLPLLYNVLMSFQKVDMFSLGQLFRPFVGFDNYIAVLSEPSTWPILRNTVTFVVASIAGQFALGFGLALFFTLKFPGAAYLRGLFLVSWVMPGLVVGAIWNWILAATPSARARASAASTSRGSASTPEPCTPCSRTKYSSGAPVPAATAATSSPSAISERRAICR